MLDLVWVALAAGVIASALGAVRAGRAGWRGWKAFRATSGTLTSGLEAVATAGTTAADRAATLTERTAELDEATARLQCSLAELAVLRRAAGRVTTRIAAARMLLPRK
jgi:hypothetical protein